MGARMAADNSKAVSVLPLVAIMLLSEEMVRESE